MPIRSVSSLDLKGKKALLRRDFNVPVKYGRIADPHRSEASLPTLTWVLKQGGSAVLCSHLGRPQNRQPELSLMRVAKYVSSRLDAEVPPAPDCVGEAADSINVKTRASQSATLYSLPRRAES